MPFLALMPSPLVAVPASALWFGLSLCVLDCWIRPRVATLRRIREALDGLEESPERPADAVPAT